jgi:hypothetical protein
LFLEKIQVTRSSFHSERCDPMSLGVVVVTNDSEING